LTRIKENLRKAYAQVANDFQQQLDSISSEQSSLDGDLDVSTKATGGGGDCFVSLNHCFYQNQLRKVQDLQTTAGQLVNKLQKVQMLSQDCIDANTEENDYTVYSVEDLTFGLDLLQQALQKKNAFIQNQVPKKKKV
jgi:hypothetical protein